MEQTNGRANSNQRRLSPRATSSDCRSAYVTIQPSTLEFAVLADKGTDGFEHAIGRCSFEVAFTSTAKKREDTPSSISTSSNLISVSSVTQGSLLVFSVRTNATNLLRVKGGWHQVLAVGDDATVEVCLKKRIAVSELRSDDLDGCRLLLTYEILDPSDTPDFRELKELWQKQRRQRVKGEPLQSLSSRHQRDGNASRANGELQWKGRNFDLLNTRSVVLPCHVNVVRSVQTAEVDVLRDQVKLKKAQLDELSQQCEALLAKNRAVVQTLQHDKSKDEAPASAPTVTPSRNLVQRLSAIVGTGTKALRLFVSEVEWMEVVGMSLVMSSTALMAISI